MSQSDIRSAENFDVTLLKAEVLREASSLRRHVLKQLLSPETFSFLLTLLWSGGESAFGENFGVFEGRSISALREEHNVFRPNSLIQFKLLSVNV